MRKARKVQVFQKYKNVGGQSKVTRFHIAKDALIVHFTNHTVYLYTNQSADPANISKMKTLALAGKGLSTFIDTNLKDRYARKMR